MDGIQIKVYCPVCREVIEMCLRKNLVKDLVDFFKSIQNFFQPQNEKPPTDKEVSYRGGKVCSCGNVIDMTFTIEAHPKRGIFLSNPEARIVRVSCNGAD